MARKTEKGGKFRNVHSRTWNMARKLKIMGAKKLYGETLYGSVTRLPAQDSALPPR